MELMFGLAGRVADYPGLRTVRINAHQLMLSCWEAGEKGGAGVPGESSKYIISDHELRTDEGDRAPDFRCTP